ncbi:MAG: valine--tRNA ligase [Pseudomonadales bacterium]|nr:valine--tRNA ligase [Pseudomonadales bacterium]
MDSRYDFKLSEEKIYKLWEEADAFNPDSVLKLRQNDADNPDSVLKLRQADAFNPDSKIELQKDKNNQPNKGTAVATGNKFSIVLPPPNANDPLHVGHAMYVVEDVMIRYHRMLGDDTLWIPGTDHAGIETQFVFEKKLKKEGKSRFNFDRKSLYQMIWQYVQENSEVAVDQLKKLGFSLDWSRFKFTLDEDIVAEVLETFQSLYRDGLIYRDFKLVNYCTKCGTSYSELEVDHVERIDPLYTIQYGPLQVSTVRPETIFGDVAIAVNPNDPRYKEYVGKHLEVEFPWGKKTMIVIADEYVDPKFGTGAVKVTPYHDANDFQMWETHKNEIIEQPIPVIDTSGKIINSPDKYNNLGVVNAREAVLKDYKSYKTAEGKSLLISVNEKYTHSVGTCYRCGRLIEPLPLPQFFIKVADDKINLVQNALNALDTNETKIFGAGREKILRHWLNNLKDWNISRQITWGISIPVWYKTDGNEENIIVNFLDKENQYQTGLLSDWLKTYSLEEIKQNIQSISANISVPYSVSVNEPTDGNYIQESDTFDTWFSSSQWPIVTLKTNNKSDFERFYPLSVMETGYDILPFWVMRMMMLGIYMTNKSPFENVYLHGLIRDEKGKKMSKSKGNVINPIEVKSEFGADALRMALIIRSTPGQDKSVGKPDFKAMRNLTNKTWNAARFIIMMTEEPHDKTVTENSPLDQEFDQKLNDIIVEVTQHFSNLKVGLAAEVVYNEFWHWFCDICIEKSKDGDVSLKKLSYGLITFLKLLHPFMPFVTETIWQELLEKKVVKNKLLIVSDWPTPVS